MLTEWCAIVILERELKISPVALILLRMQLNGGFGMHTHTLCCAPKSSQLPCLFDLLRRYWATIARKQGEWPKVTAIAIDTALLARTAEIVASYVGHNQIPQPDLPRLIQSVHSALSAVGTVTEPEALAAPKPAVPIKKSVTDDYIVCLEDGMKLKLLKRYLRTQFDLSPEAYREKWGLPDDYPMVAPNYAAVRSQLAKRFGLGKTTRE